MTDQMRGDMLAPGSSCICPNLRALAERGVRFSRAYASSPTCSPARASLMTGRLPHTHGVTEVTHCIPDDCSVLREQYPHWAQHLTDAGYRTAYVGKWHIDKNNQAGPYGWELDGSSFAPIWQKRFSEWWDPSRITNHRLNDQPAGYQSPIHYGVTDVRPEQRDIGHVYELTSEWLNDLTNGDDPWCCFASAHAPHDPFVVGAEAFSQYDPDVLQLSPNAHDDLADRPGLYRKLTRVWDNMTEDQHRTCMACYMAMITEVDQFFGRLLKQLDESGQADNTIVIFTSDHGELLGSHGLYCKNVSAFEEVYRIPMLIAGPGIAAGEESSARVGLHDLAATLPELADAESLNTEKESRSFASLLGADRAADNDWQIGYAEGEGNVFRYTHRVLWDGNWKFVFNGFDEDEMYNLADDPYEMNNLINDPEHQQRADELMATTWRIASDCNDPIAPVHYPGLRLGRVGPLAVN